jgi:dGTPase
MNWSQLISAKRLGQEHTTLKKEEQRTEFQRDYDRLVFSAPFRRLQNKTQVFPLPGSVFVHNRLTHSLEVSSVGRSLGADVSRLLLERHPELHDTGIREIGTIISAACLAHDLGNPPFGHSGERAINSYFSEGKGQSLRSYVEPKTGNRLTEREWNDLTHFEGNANAFRLLTHQFKGRRKGGFVMTYSTLASIVKYPFPSTLAGEHAKFGFFCSEEETYLKIAKELGLASEEVQTGDRKFPRFPLVYLVEAADDICYEVMDIEDSFKLKILSFEETRELLLGFFCEEEKKTILQHLQGVTDLSEQVNCFRSFAIGKLERSCVEVFVEHESEILAGTFKGELIEHVHPQVKAAYEHCVTTSFKKIYCSKEVVDIELAGYEVISTLLNVLIQAVLYPENAYSRILLNRIPSQYETDAPTVYGRIISVLDYVSGMTDVYALDLYQKIKGMSLPIV